MSDAGLTQALATLLDLGRRARHAGSPRELGFLLANDTHALVPYRQAALWLAEEGIHTLSGVVQAEANAPYALWLERVCCHLAAPASDPTCTLTSAQLPAELAQDWSQWWPAHALWLLMPGTETTSAGAASAAPRAGLLLVREQAWTAQEQALLREWADVWWHAFHAVHQPRLLGWQAFLARIRPHFSLQPDRKWWQQTRLRWAAALLAVMLLPVRLSVLAPGELVPAHPVVIRSPLDGVVDTFHVQPNQSVRKGQPLFGFDEALIRSRLEVAEQSLATAETEYRQVTQQALSDAKYRTQLALLTGKIEEKRAEAEFLREQLQRSRVLAPQDGIVLFDDPSEWTGRPVSVGERIMRLAATSDSEVEAWLPLADAIALEPGASVKLYLNASPLSPVSARVRYMAHDALQRPDGAYAYRVRASLDEPTGHRVGLKGTAKLHGGWVPLAYWMLRRPLAALRTATGI